MSKVYGIDLGTTYSVITTLDDNGMPLVIANQADSRDELASAVYFQDSGDPVIGDVAKQQKDIEPERVVEFVKRFIGKEGAPTYSFNGVDYTPIDISAMILKHMKQYADEQGHDVQDVVITCPAYFGSVERTATKQAGQIAGLNVMNIVNEPVAAALNYCYREFKENRKIMVYDLGGGTFDVTLFDFLVNEDGVASFDAILTDGNDSLGGIDWDNCLFEYLCGKYKNEIGLDSSDTLDAEAAQTIRAQVEQIKRDLSQLEKKSYNFNCAGERTRIEATRADFEACTKTLVEQTMDFVRHLLNRASCTPDDIDVVLLVGGSTKMPMIKNAVEAMFPGKVKVEDPNLAVAKGAALAAALQFHETYGDSVEDTTTAVDPAKPGDPSAQKPQPTVPNLVTAISITDRLVRSMGPGVLFGNDYLIENLLFVGDKSPAEADAIYGTRDDNMPEIVLEVFENLSEDRVNKRITPCVDAYGNPQYTDPALKVRKIGELTLKLPPNTPKGSRIRVIFRSSTIGLEVQAINMATNEHAETTITSDGILTAEEVAVKQKEMGEVKTASDY